MSIFVPAILLPMVGRWDECFILPSALIRSAPDPIRSDLVQPSQRCMQLWLQQQRGWRQLRANLVPAEACLECGVTDITTTTTTTSSGSRSGICSSSVAGRLCRVHCSETVGGGGTFVWVVRFGVLATATAL
mmetsp:Transcript_31192/g.75400  ORF Transcript_31192/g.75400 Transcript_31192/m.75400 type:complete len:132 (+) Transcript_31192:134-529(+)